MNPDQIASLIRTVLKIVSGLLLAHGLTDTATLINTPDVIGALTLIVSLAWSHFSHSAAPDSPKPPSAGGTSLLLVAISVMSASVLLIGCVQIAPGNRAVIVRAEQSLAIGNATLDSAVHIDDANRSFWKTNLPAFHQFCESLRAPVLMYPLTNIYPRGVAIIKSCDAVKETYKRSNATNDYTRLISALATVETATSEAQKFILQTNQK